MGYSVSDRYLTVVSSVAVQKTAIVLWAGDEWKTCGDFVDTFLFGERSRRWISESDCFTLDLGSSCEAFEFQIFF